MTVKLQLVLKDRQTKEKPLRNWIKVLDEYLRSWTWMLRQRLFARVRWPGTRLPDLQALNLTTLVRWLIPTLHLLSLRIFVLLVCYLALNTRVFVNTELSLSLFQILLYSCHVWKAESIFSWEHQKISHCFKWWFWYILFFLEYLMLYGRYKK